MLLLSLHSAVSLLPAREALPAAVAGTAVVLVLLAWVLPVLDILRQRSRTRHSRS
jgi:hypothetical protein